MHGMPESFFVDDKDFVVGLESHQMDGEKRMRSSLISPTRVRIPE